MIAAALILALLVAAAVLIATINRARTARARAYARTVVPPLTDADRAIADADHVLTIALLLDAIRNPESDGAR